MLALSDLFSSQISLLSATSAVQCVGHGGCVDLFRETKQTKNYWLSVEPQQSLPVVSLTDIGNNGCNVIWDFLYDMPAIYLSRYIYLSPCCAVRAASRPDQPRAESRKQARLGRARAERRDQRAGQAGPGQGREQKAGQAGPGQGREQ